MTGRWATTKDRQQQWPRQPNGVFISPIDDGVSQYQQRRRILPQLLLPSRRRHEVNIVRSSSAAENLSKPVVHYHYRRRRRRHATIGPAHTSRACAPRSCASRGCKSRRRWSLASRIAYGSEALRSTTTRTTLSSSPSFGLRSSSGARQLAPVGVNPTVVRSTVVTDRDGVGRSAIFQNIVINRNHIIIIIIINKR